MANLVVKHLLHDGTPVGETNPINPEWIIRIDDAASINYEIPKNIGLADPAYTFPYLTDWRLERNDVPLLAGIHTPVNTTENLGDTVKVTGLDWLHYFEKRFYPFDPANPTAYFYSVVDTPANTIINALFTAVLAQTHSLDGVTISALGTFPHINYQITPAETADMFSKLKDLAQQIPFDFEMTWDRNLKLYYPTRGSIVDVAQLPKNLEGIQFVNNGLTGNSLLALGEGTSQLGVLLVNETSMGTFRRLDYTQSFGNVTNMANLTSRAQQDLNTSSNPVLPITMIVHIDAWPTFWDDVSVGDSIPVTADIGYTQLDNELLRIVEITGRQDNNGVETAELAFNLG